MNSNEQSQLAEHYHQLYRTHLLENIIPFWMRHGVDREHGGISNMLDENGNAVAYDKYLWSQGRALWTFSALYNRIEKRDEWLEFAHHIYEYIIAHGRGENGHWLYRLDKDGNILDRDISISVDGFVMTGLAEYYAATGKPEALQFALETYERVSARLLQPGSYGLAPYEIPSGMKAHGVAMLFSFFFYNLGEVAASDKIKDHGVELAREILNDFYVPEYDAILEYVSLDGEFVDSPEGRACVPGHAIEALWFLITIFERSGNQALIPRCCELIKRHLELAWDEEFGGLKLALDIKGQTPGYWKHADYKPWWVQVEALVATAYAFVHTGEPWCMEWHQRVQEWTWAHYPAPAGEWRQWVDRSGQPTASAVLPVKDPFHLPRALMYLIDVFENRIPDRHKL